MLLFVLLAACTRPDPVVTPDPRPVAEPVAGDSEQALPLDTGGIGAAPAVVGTTWRLDVRDPDGATLGTLVVRFTDAPARTCAGDMRVAQVLSATGARPDFSLAQGPLTYELGLRDGTGIFLHLGHHGLCDAYRTLQGRLDATHVEGRYVRWGWVTEVLGSFSGVPVTDGPAPAAP